LQFLSVSIAQAFGLRVLRVRENEVEELVGLEGGNDVVPILVSAESVDGLLVLEAGHVVGLGMDGDWTWVVSDFFINGVPDQVVRPRVLG